MILFLDFDGVVHPTGGDDPLFCHLPRLEELLREFPEVKVVISSSWREIHPFDEIQEYFSEDIQGRVIGTTPLEGSTPHGRPIVLREHEIQSWLFRNGGLQQQWVALDDCMQHFQHHLDRLVPCRSSVGFDDQAQERLRQHFEKARIS